MSTHQRNIDSSLNNLPERDAWNLISGSSSGSTGIIIHGHGKEGSIPMDMDNTNEQKQAPIDKHGDTWGGGISGHSKQFK